MIGDKRYTEALDVVRRGRGAFLVGRSLMVIDGGLLRSEHVDMSNDKGGEIPPRRKPKVSWATFVVPGLAGT